MKKYLELCVLIQFLLICQASFTLSESDYELVYEDDPSPAKTSSQKTEEYDYYSIQDEPAEKKNDPRDYCKLTVNAMVFPLKRFAQANQQAAVPAYFGDDLSFECSVPEQFLDSRVNWLMNGTTIDVKDKFFNLAVDRQMANKSTRLLISSSFKLKNKPESQLIQFPVIAFGK